MPRSRRKSALLRQSDKKIPGVGIYSPNAAIAKKSAPNFTLGKRFDTQRKESTSPGPAAYTPVQGENRSISMTRERRPGNQSPSNKQLLGSNSKKLNVGPSQYILTSIFESRLKNGVKFSKASNRRSPKYVE